MKLLKEAQHLQHVTPEECGTDSPCVSSRAGRKRLRSPSPPTVVSPQEEANQRSVSFHGLVNCIEIMHIDDMSQEVIDAQWLTGEEMRDIRDKATEIARNMTCNGKQVVDDSDEQCFRGLEYRVKEGYVNRRDKRDLVRAAVHLMQDIHGSDNPGKVAFASMRNSLASRKEAVERAKQDALFAQEYLAGVSGQ